jgi:hypothetical protein
VEGCRAVCFASGHLSLCVADHNRIAHVLGYWGVFPIQIAVGAITGFLAERYFDWPLTRWTWIVPLVILLASMIFVPPPHGVSLFRYWFGW